MFGVPLYSLIVLPYTVAAVAEVCAGVPDGCAVSIAAVVLAIATLFWAFCMVESVSNAPNSDVSAPKFRLDCPCPAVHRPLFLRLTPSFAIVTLAYPLDQAQCFLSFDPALGFDCLMAFRGTLHSVCSPQLTRTPSSRRTTE